MPRRPSPSRGTSRLGAGAYSLWRICRRHSDPLDGRLSRARPRRSGTRRDASHTQPATSPDEYAGPARRSDPNIIDLSQPARGRLDHCVVWPRVQSRYTASARSLPPARADAQPTISDPATSPASSGPSSLNHLPTSSPTGRSRPSGARSTNSALASVSARRSETSRHRRGLRDSSTGTSPTWEPCRRDDDVRCDNAPCRSSTTVRNQPSPLSSVSDGGPSTADGPAIARVLPRSPSGRHRSNRKAGGPQERRGRRTSPDRLCVPPVASTLRSMHPSRNAQPRWFIDPTAHARGQRPVPPYSTRPRLPPSTIA